MSGRQEQDAGSGGRISYKIEEDCETPRKCLEKSCTGYLHAALHTRPLKFILRSKIAKKNHDNRTLFFEVRNPKNSR